MPAPLVLLQMLSTALATSQAALEVVGKINARLTAAHNEGREVTDEEVKALQDANDARAERVKQLLLEAASR